MIRAEVVSIDDMVLAINGSESMGCYMEILEALKHEMDAMLGHYSRVLFVRLDIRQRDYSGDNSAMSEFCRKLKKHLSRHYQTNRIGHLWVREMEKAKRQHYHLVLMLDGHKVRHPSKLIRKVEAIAEGWDWPRPYTPQNCYYLIKRNDADTYAKAFYRASYLAKERGKGYKDSTANNYGRSNVRAA